MKKIILVLCLFFTKVAYALHSDKDYVGAYGSGGVQWGYTFSKGSFWGLQLTVGKDIFEPASFLGFTSGIRSYQKDLHFYTDIQYSLLTTGAGVGADWTLKNRFINFSGYRLKGWAGAYFLGAVDLLLSKDDINKSYFSASGMIVLPYLFDRSNACWDGCNE